MLKTAMSDNLILQLSVRTMVPSVADIFLTLPETSIIPGGLKNSAKEIF